jgi:hypothetical protein
MRWPHGYKDGAAGLFLTARRDNDGLHPYNHPRRDLAITGCQVHLLIAGDSTSVAAIEAQGRRCACRAHLSSRP